MYDDWDEDDDEEFVDDAYADVDDEPTVDCPYCGREIHEDAQRCPYCERYISLEDAPTAPKPWWIVLGVIVCLVLLLGWIIW